MTNIRTAKEFCVFLEGFLDGKEELNEIQIKKMKDSLNDVFYHEIDKKTPDPDGKLQDIHDGKRDIHGMILDAPPVLPSPLTPEQEEAVRDMIDNSVRPENRKYTC